MPRARHLAHRARNGLELLHELLLKGEVRHEGTVLVERLRDGDLEVKASTANLPCDLGLRQRLELRQVLSEQRLASLERLGLRRTTISIGAATAWDGTSMEHSNHTSGGW